MAAGLGALMFYKLFSIWSWHRTGWYALLSFAVVGALANGLELARGYGSGWTWASVIGGFAVAFYLACRRFGSRSSASTGTGGARSGLETRRAERA